MSDMGAHPTASARIVCAQSDLRLSLDQVRRERAALAATETVHQSRCQKYADRGMTQAEKKQVLGTDPPAGVTFQ